MDRLNPRIKRRFRVIVLAPHAELERMGLASDGYGTPCGCPDQAE